MQQNAQSNQIQTTTHDNRARKRLLKTENYLPTLCLFSLVDICKNHKSLTDARRHYKRVLDKPKKSICDNWANGWYRFREGAGTKMRTKCPPRNRCYTKNPAWLSGGHPTVANGIVTKKVCIHVSGGCCGKSVYIKVKNCGSYYIYKLTAPPFCDVRYCGD